jgi:hypothetical protein
MVRNTGDKVLRLHQLLPTDFALKNSQTGAPVSFTFVSKPAFVGHGLGTVIHLRVEWWPDRQPMPEKGVLTMKANAFNLLPEDLVLSDIPLDAGRVKR